MPLYRCGPHRFQAGHSRTTAVVDPVRLGITTSACCAAAPGVGRSQHRLTAELEGSSRSYRPRRSPSGIQTHPALAASAVREPLNAAAATRAGHLQTWPRADPWSALLPPRADWQTPPSAHCALSKRGAHMRNFRAPIPLCRAGPVALRGRPRRAISNVEEADVAVHVAGHTSERASDVRAPLRGRTLEEADVAVHDQMPYML